MALGGVPFYLGKVEPGLSATQAIEDLGFKRNSFLLREFSGLYATLFGTEEAFIDIARVIADHRYGIDAEEIVRILKLTRGGRLTKRLQALEEAGFITSFTPFGSKRKGVFYKMTDEYSLFYFRWIEPIAGALLAEDQGAGYWSRMKHSPSYWSWSGYAFEALCFKHITNIRNALSIPPGSLAYTWRYVPKKGDSQGAQIDLLFDRPDNSITIGEITFSQQPYVLDKDAAQKLLRQIEVFEQRTHTTKNIFTCFIAPQGLKKTLYSEQYVQGVATLRDLFKGT